MIKISFKIQILVCTLFFCASNFIQAQDGYDGITTSSTIIEDELLGGGDQTGLCWTTNEPIIYTGPASSGLGLMAPIDPNNSNIIKWYEIRATSTCFNAQFQAYYRNNQWHIRKSSNVNYVCNQGVEPLWVPRCFFQGATCNAKLMPVVNSDNTLNFVSLDKFNPINIEIKKVFNTYTCAVNPTSIAYPNPTSGMVYLDLTSEVNDTAYILVFDNNGNLVQSTGNFILYKGVTITQTVNLSNQNNGYYHIQVHREHYMSDFVVQKI